jgi:type IV pilus assembly protein PilB
MADPTNIFAVDPVQFRTGLKVQPVVAAESAIARAILRLYGEEKGLALTQAPGANGRARTVSDDAEPAQELEANDIAFEGVQIDPDALGEDEADVEQVQVGPEEIDLASLTRGGSDRPVVGLVNRILVEAYRRGASDIHIEPYEKEFSVRFRIDGLLTEFGNLPPRVRESVTTRIKIMANLDIAERRLPQGGRIKIRMRQDDRARDLDFRVSCLPTLWGEKIVLRLLDKSKLMLDMTKLGFEPGSLERFKAAIAKPYGIVLVTGPTGSGKTNTLYSALQALNRRDTNIMTAEDPVEFNLRGINQVQIRENVGLSFAMALREFLRQDPNIILVGEIRDYETAEIAVKAALTGHLVLSTLHTNDAPSTISRMVNMGIEPFLVGTAVNLIQAQRLVRRVCAKCKVDVTAEVPTKTLVDIGFGPDVIGTFQVYKGKGCGNCNGTGYKGRVGLYEVMEITEGIRDLIMVGATAVEIKRKALEEGMLTLRLSGLEKIKNGVTTVEEVLRETVL